MLRAQLPGVKVQNMWLRSATDIKAMCESFNTCSK